MPESFGTGLRQRRERLQVSLTTIAEQTKIKQSLLEALERDDVSRWPPGIFRRAFIRSYAEAIGLDPDIIARDFLALHPDPIEPGWIVPAIIPGANPAPFGEASSSRFGHLVGVAIDAFTSFRRGKTTPPEPAKHREATARQEPIAHREPVTHREPLMHREPVTTVERSLPVIAAVAAEDRTPVKPIHPASKPDLLAAAHLCTEMAQVDEIGDAAPLIQQAVRILDAVGLIVWVWNPQATELTPALTYGYSDSVLAQLPTVRRDDDNATAAAFRSAQTSVVTGSNVASGALVVPLMTRGGCVGVLAIELKDDIAQRESVRALVIIFAAQLARLVGIARSMKTVDRRLA